MTWPRKVAVVDLHWLEVFVTRGGPAMRESTTPMPMSDHVSRCVFVCLCVSSRVIRSSSSCCVLELCGVCL